MFPMILTALALVPAIAQECCTDILQMDISAKNVTEQTNLLNTVQDSLLNGTLANPRNLTRQELTKSTYCWAMTMKNNLAKQNNMTDKYSSFLGNVKKMYLEQFNDSKVDLTIQCQLTPTTLRDVAYVISAIVIFFIVWGFVSTNDERRLLELCGCLKREEKVPGADNYDDLEMVKIVSYCPIVELKSCLPSRDQNSSRPRAPRTVEFAPLRKVRVYDVHELEDFRNLDKLKERKMRKMRQAAARAASEANAQQSTVDTQSVTEEVQCPSPIVSSRARSNSL